MTYIFTSAKNLQTIFFTHTLLNELVYSIINFQTQKKSSYNIESTNKTSETYSFLNIAINAHMLINLHKEITYALVSDRCYI